MDPFFVLISLLCLSASAFPGELVEDIANATYDYIVVGCGIAGLVVAMRLSESTNVSVLCVEAGPLDQYEEIIQFPVYIGRDIGGAYDWNINTTPQIQLDGATRPLPLGKVLGGGSILNGMVWNRGNRDDYDAWESFGNPGWSWDDLLPYFKKSETFTPKSYPGLTPEQQPVTFLEDAHGFSGPVQVSYPAYYWNQSTNWFDALNELGIPTIFDPNDGTSAGAYYLPADIDPNNQTRSDARRTYYDPYIRRDNFQLLASSQVTRILFSTYSGGARSSESAHENGEYPTNPKQIDSSSSSPEDQDKTSSAKRQSQEILLQATGVEYAPNAAGPRQTVFARQEVILAAGALHSPALLQLSGIGPAELLRSLNIPVIEDLPGVGSNLQDHCLVNLDYAYQSKNIVTPYTFNTNASFDDASETQYLQSKTGPWTAEPSNAVAFPSLTQITTMVWDMVTRAKTATRQLPSTYDRTLRAGYELQFAALLQLLPQNNTPAYEILNNNAGGLTVSLMHPLSRGLVQITSADPLAAPAIDPRWLTNPFDRQVMIAAMQFNQRILDTAPIQELIPIYDHVPANATAEQLTAILNSGIRTEFHYSGTCAMMPRELGGVVDPNLRVYGTSNVRVVDTSICPVVPAAHMQAVAYGVAEKAADLIKQSNVAYRGAETVPQEAAPATPKSTTTTTTTATTADQDTSDSYMTWLKSLLHLSGSGGGSTSGGQPRTKP